MSKFNNEVKKNIKHLTSENIFIFGIKPNNPSDQFGYFFSKKKTQHNLNKVIKFIEKPSHKKAKIIIKKKRLLEFRNVLIKKRLNYI